MWGAPAPAAAAADFRLPYPADGDSVSTMKFNPAGSMLSAGGWDCKVRIWELQRSATGACAAAKPLLEQAFGGPVLDSCWKETGQHMFVAGTDNTVQLWDLATNTKQAVAKHDAPVKSCVWIPERGYLITASWDQTLRYWDLKSAAPAASVALGERVMSMDARAPACVVALAEGSVAGSAAKEKRVLIFDLNAPQAPVRVMNSPLRQQTRCVRLSIDSAQYAIGSIEGRCSVRWLNPTQDALPVDANGPFAFKCHRMGAAALDIFPLNALDFHPTQLTVFATLGGGDCTVSFWNKQERKRLREFPRRELGSEYPGTAGAWSPDGHWFAYALTNDWSQGVDMKSPGPNMLGVHQVRPADITLAPAAARR